MATLEAIRTAVAATLTAALGAGTELYDRIPGQPVLPCVCVVPDSANFDVAMGRGTDTWQLDLVVLVPSGDSEVGQSRLDPYVTGAGSLSIRQAIFNTRDLGLSNTDAHVSAMSDYGGSFEAVDVDHIGARLRLVVHTRGTA
jgi:hypothetical protein